MPEIVNAVPLPMPNKNLSSSIFTAESEKATDTVKTDEPVQVCGVLY